MSRADKFCQAALGLRAFARRLPETGLLLLLFPSDHDVDHSDGSTADAQGIAVVADSNWRQNDPPLSLQHAIFPYGSEESSQREPLADPRSAESTSTARSRCRFIAQIVEQL
jgi:hypothetical protein